MTRAPDVGDINLLAWDIARVNGRSMPRPLDVDLAAALLAPGGAVDTIANQRAAEELDALASRMPNRHGTVAGTGALVWDFCRDRAAALRNGQPS